MEDYTHDYSSSLESDEEREIFRIVETALSRQVQDTLGMLRSTLPAYVATNQLGSNALRATQALREKLVSPKNSGDSE